MNLNCLFKFKDIGRVSSILLFRVYPITSRVIASKTNLRQQQRDTHGYLSQNAYLTGVIRGAQRKEDTEDATQSNEHAQSNNVVLSSQETAGSTTEHLINNNSNEHKLNTTSQLESATGYLAPEHQNMKFVDPSSHFAYNKGNRGAEYEDETHDEAFRRQQQIQDALKKESMRKFLKQFLMAFGFVLTAHAFLFIMAKKQGVFELERVRDSEGKVVHVLPTEVVEEIAIEEGNNRAGLAKGESKRDSQKKINESASASKGNSLELSAPNVVAAHQSQGTLSANGNAIFKESKASALKANSEPNKAHEGIRQMEASLRDGGKGSNSSMPSQTWGEYIWSFYPLSWIWPASGPENQINENSPKTATSNTNTAVQDGPPDNNTESLHSKVYPSNTAISENHEPKVVDEAEMQRQMDISFEAAIERLAASSSLSEAEAVHEDGGSHPRVIRVRAPRFAVRRESLLLLQDDDEEGELLNSGLKSRNAER